jgi:hypothetical protein
VVGGGVSILLQRKVITKFFNELYHIYNQPKSELLLEVTHNTTAASLENEKLKLENKKQERHRWLTSVTLATGKAEIRRITNGIVLETPCPK